MYNIQAYRNTYNCVTVTQINTYSISIIPLCLYKRHAISPWEMPNVTASVNMQREATMKQYTHRGRWKYQMSGLGWFESHSSLATLIVVKLKEKSCVLSLLIFLNSLKWEDESHCQKQDSETFPHFLYYEFGHFSDGSGQLAFCLLVFLWSYGIPPPSVPCVSSSIYVHAWTHTMCPHNL